MPQKNTSTFRYKEGDENGSRVYQLMLNTMQILPVPDVFEISNTFPTSDVPLKRKSSIDTNIKTHKKKARIQNITTGKMATRQTANNAKASSSSKPDVTMDIT